MDDATSPENLASLQVWTPEQQARELTRRYQLIIGLSESYTPFTPKPSDVIVAVPPKNGTTWLLHICHQIRVQGAEPDVEHQVPDVLGFLDLGKALFGVEPDEVQQPAEPRLFCSHFPYIRVPKGGKLIYCFREQNDAMYSLYTHTNSMVLLRDRVSLPLFAKTMIALGHVKRVLNDLLEWWEHRNDENILVVFFDDLKEDHTGCVRRIAKFMGIDCDEEVIARVGHTTSHAEMARHSSKFDVSRETVKIAKMLGEDPPTEYHSRVRRDGGRSGDGKIIPPDVQQCITDQWKEIITAKLGFENLKDMRDAWHKEQKLKAV